MTTPLQLLQQWLDAEKAAGAVHAQNVVLSTVSAQGEPHSRVVAIREINDESLIFFTQNKTPKVEEIRVCPSVSLTFWFERHARQVMMEGTATFLSPDQNKQYWENYPREAQIRFHAYAPTSGEPISDKADLERKRVDIEKQYQDTLVPLSPDYCGVSIQPSRFVFYSYRRDELSDVWEYEQASGFVGRRLSP